MDLKTNPNPTYSSIAISGGSKQGAKKWNEDSFLTWSSSNNKVIFGGVWDGHGGYNGLLASQTVRDETHAWLNRNNETCETWDVPRWKSELHDLFQRVHLQIAERFVSESQDAKASMHRLISDNNIVRTANGDPVHGGTTATVSVLVRDIDPETHNSVLITANVGDSTGLLVSPGDPVAFTTVDHGPESESEYARVQDMNLQKSLLFVYDKTNVFRKYECPAIFKPNGVKDEKFVTNPWGNGLHPTNVRYEPAVYAVTPRTVSKDSTCIAMTRALGDFYAHPFGLTSVPDIQVQQLSAEKDYVVIVGSDGIWDCWKYEDYSNYTLLGLYNKNQSILEFGEEALNESIRRAYTNFGPKHYDDAALVMFRLQASESKNNAASNTSSNTVENASSQPTNSQQVPATEVDGDVVMSPTKSATEL